ncbi:MAG: homoserine dehydrogenase [Clostridia bacterium]|nr:homoserine dehydrogenase [Clostridia bacterium]
MINIAIMGHGTVGSGVAELLINENGRIEDAVKSQINVKYILDLRKFDNLSYSDKFTDDFKVISDDDEIKIVVEVMGGINPAYQFVKECLLKGKSVVTSNKELVAAKGAELIDIANKNNVNFLFEASVGGGIPILRPLISCLAANEISEINGILNGTTNFILNKMIKDNMDFEDALKIAQDKGYAEKDPTADIEGHDACRKICILAALAFKKHVYPNQVETTGITDITLDDIEYADNFGFVIKLIGSAKKLASGNISASVRPTLVSKENMLSNVDGVFNAISVKGDAVGDVLFYGRGAGKMPTASAVVGDVIDCAKHLNAREYLYWNDGFDSYVETPDESTVLYVNATSDNSSELLESIISLFGEDIKMLRSSKDNSVAFLTNKDTKSKLLSKIKCIKADKIKILHTLF